MADFGVLGGGTNASSHETTVAVFIPVSQVGVVIGKGGKMIQDISRQSGAKIDISAMANDEWSSLLARPLGEHAGEVEATIKGAFGHEPSHTFSAGPSRVHSVQSGRLG
jgi:predicted PilT family ATPase